MILTPERRPISVAGGPWATPTRTITSGRARVRVSAARLDQPAVPSRGLTKNGVAPPPGARRPIRMPGGAARARTRPLFLSVDWGGYTDPAPPRPRRRGAAAVRSGAQYRRTAPFVVIIDSFFPAPALCSRPLPCPLESNQSKSSLRLGAGRFPWVPK